MNAAKKSYWIWQYGEFEVYHNMQVNLRREEMGHACPPCWRLSTPYPSVCFRRVVTAPEGGWMQVTAMGDGAINFDGKAYPMGARIDIPAGGEHYVRIYVANPSAFCAVYIESDVCPSDATWTCRPITGDYTPVGTNPAYDSLCFTPDRLPYAYSRMEPVAVEAVNGGLLYDFGRELFGFLDLSGGPDRPVSLFYGESREEALDTGHAYLSDTFVGQARLRQRAFRYVFIAHPQPLCVSADYEYLPFEQIGRFSCDNELFNRIYDTSVYTFHLNCREGFLDGIKRDRWVWSGDAYQSARINRCLFADKDIEQRTAIGLAGKDPVDQHMNTIPDYTMLWLIGLWEHHEFYGDTDYLRRILPMAEKQLALVEQGLNAEGFFEGRKGDWIFIDWSKIDKTGAVCAEQMLLCAAYKAMASICGALGLDGGHYRESAEDLARRITQFYWREELGAFIDSYASGLENVTRHANIFALMYDIATPEQAARIVPCVLENDAIRPITTPYFRGYELDVLARLGKFGLIEKALREYWGGMLALGATTLWEEYDPTLSGAEHYAMYGGKYNKSLCHAWGAGPVYLFGRYYLGVRPTAPGCASFEVSPHLGGLREMHGCVPLLGGSVQVDMDAEQVTVLATRPGGTVCLGGKRYDLEQNVPLTVRI